MSDALRERRELADVVRRLEDLRQALAAGDLAGVAAQARAIRGIAGRINAVNLVSSCRHLELDASHHVTENLDRLLLEAEVDLRALVFSANGGGSLSLSA